MRDRHLVTNPHGLFDAFTSTATKVAGHPVTFGLAVLVVIVWFAGGPFFGFSDSYQLIINTGTTIVTFIMVFALQASQNRDTLAVQTKLDELIRSSAARNEFIGLDKRTAAEIEAARIGTPHG